MTDPAIQLTVVIPAYNYANTLERAAMSVIPQLNATRELIIIDDGSTDETPKVIEQLRRRLGGDNISFIRKDNGGPSSVRNLAIRSAKGSFLIFLDADDELMLDALDLFDKHIKSNTITRMIIGGHVSVELNGTKRTHLPQGIPATPYDRVSGYLLKKNINLSNGACAMHKDIFLSGGYPEQFRSAEDIPVFAQALANHECSVIERAVLILHKHKGSLRHNLEHATTVGISIVDEIFSTQRLGDKFSSLKRPYMVQRYLSLFRSAYLAHDDAMACRYYRHAFSTDWKVIFRGSTARKAFRLWLRKR